MFNFKQSLNFYANHKDALSLLASESAGLIEQSPGNKQREWKSTIEHCLAVSVVGEKIARLIGLDGHQINQIVDFLAVHDLLKRYEVSNSWRESHQDELKILESKLIKFDPSGVFKRATCPEYILGGHYLNASIQEKIIHYSDNLCSLGIVTTPESRLSEVAARRPDLGSEYFQKELEVTKLESEYLVELINIENDLKYTCQDLPWHIIAHLSNGLLPYNRSQMIEEMKATTESGIALGKDFVVDWYLRTPRASRSANEDQVVIKALPNGFRFLVIDGATSLTSNWKLDISSGRLAANIIAKVGLSAPWEATPVEVLRLANQALAIERGKLFEDASSGGYSASCLVVHLEFIKKAGAISKVHLHYASLGDCDLAIQTASYGIQALNLGSDVEEFEIKEIKSAQAELLKARSGVSLASFLDNPNQFPETYALIEKHRACENSSDGRGYGSLKGSPWNDTFRYLITGSKAYDIDDLIDIVGWSDGAVDSVSVPYQLRIAQLMKDIKSGGVTSVVNARFNRGNNNQDCVSPACLKNNDDAAIFHLRNLRK